MCIFIHIEVKVKGRTKCLNSLAFYKLSRAASKIIYLQKFPSCNKLSRMQKTPCPDGPLQIGKSAQASNTLFLSLVLPTRNEADSIQKVIELVSDTLEKKLGNAFEIIVVDDKSTDATRAIVSELSKRFSHLRLVERDNESGLSTAVIRGWQVAKGNVLGVMDADLQHDPKILASLIDSLSNSTSLVVASRHAPDGGLSEWSAVRRFISRFAQTIGLLILPEVLGRIKDPLSGYFIVRREAIEDTLLSPRGYKILLEVIAKGRILEVQEVGYVFEERKHGESKLNLKIYLDYIHHLLELRLKTPPKIKETTFTKKQAVTFLIVGAIGLGLDMGIFKLFIDGGATLLKSKLASGLFAMANNFILHTKITWKNHKEYKSIPGLRRLLTFSSICTLGLLIGCASVTIFHYVFLISPLYANLCAILISGAFNSWLLLNLQWGPGTTSSNSAH